MILILLLLLNCSQVQASEEKQVLKNYILKELEEQHLVHSAINEKDLAPEGYEFVLQTVRFRIRASLGVQIPLFAKFEFLPYLEFFWNRRSVQRN